jgi:uncharacterized membrane protein YdjX (TVP38/TMEM64 family)
MSVNFGKRRNVGILLGIIVSTVVLVFVGTQFLRNSMGWNLIGELAYAFLILVLALFAYDKLLVR